MQEMNIQGPFEKFVDSPYYFKSELCGGTVTVSFWKYFPWQAMHFLQRSTHCSKTCADRLPQASGDSGTGTVLGLPLRVSSFTVVSPSLKGIHHLKTAARPLHRLHGLDG
jgi:hypothetical protein